MLTTSIVRQVAFVTLFSAGVTASVSHGQETVDLTAKYQPGRTSYVYIDTELVSDNKSPMGEFSMTLHTTSGVLCDVAEAGNGVELSLMIDRAGMTFDSSMGRSFYDSDVPDEEQSQQWEQILGPQVGMKLTLALDAQNRVTSCSGMEAIAKRIDESAAGNMFWTMEKPRYTDEKHQQSWTNQTLSIFPNRQIKVGDTWTAPYLEEAAGLKDFRFACNYTLDRLTQKNGRRLAHVKFQGKPSGRQQYDADSMMPMSNTKLDKATLSGTATIDVERGELVYREDHVEIAFRAAMGTAGGDPNASTSNKITRKYEIRTPAERRTEKRENERVAAAKKSEADAKRKELRRRFANTEQVAVNTAARTDPGQTANAWPQWGGPKGDFKAASSGLADKWPTTGPRQLWSRPLGDGYSAIASDGKRLYTMYRPMDEEQNKTHEIIIALDPKSGRTIWEFKYQALFDADMDPSFGRGPHSTPLIVGDRLFAIGAMLDLHCLDKNSGSVIWSRDLHEEFNASTMMYGYGASPLAFEDTIVLPIGGEGQAVVALRHTDGSVAWQSQDFGPTQSSPCVINVGTVTELISFSAAEVAGLDPSTGALHWRVEQPTEWGANIATPVWGDDGTLFISSAYSMGSRGIQLTEAGGKVTAKELWHNRKMKIHHGNAVRVGNFVYGSSGDFGAVFYAAVDIESGEIAWKNREVGKATSIYADGKMIILNENGMLFLAKVSPAGIEVLSEVELFSGRTWTVPTLVGKHLFVRDRKMIVALDIG